MALLFRVRRGRAGSSSLRSSSRGTSVSCSVHESHSSRLERTRTSRRRDGPRRGRRDRAEAGQGSRARTRRTAASQDLRLPLEDGQPIQILTTRDTADPDALYVLRHSAAHLLAEAVRRLYPGDEDRDRPADRERLLLRLRVPGADRRGGARADRGGDPARARRRAAPGSARRSPPTRRSARFAARARTTRSSSSTPPRARSRSTRRATSPTSAAARTSRTRSRSRRSS